MTDCLQNFAFRQTKCALDWFKNTSVQPCSNFEEFEQIQNIWNWLFDATYNEIIEKTGCMQKCSHFDYVIVDKREEIISWDKPKWISEFYAFTDSEIVEERHFVFLI